MTTVAATNTPRVLEVGCGTKKTPGTVGLDLLPLPGVDIVHNMEEFPWPVEAGAFDEVRCFHVLEHVIDICGVMDELHRVTRPGGRCHIVVPYFARYSAFKDPTHRRFCTFESFNYFVEGTKDRDRGYSRHAWRYVVHKLNFRTGVRGRLGAWIHGRSHRNYERHWAHTFPARTLEIVLEPLADSAS